MTTLTTTHAAQLDASAITDTIRRERGYWSATDAAELTRRDGHLADYQKRLPALAYPVYRLGKPYTMITRPDDPRTETRDGKTRTVKYEWPAGLPLCIDILPRYRDSLRDTSIPIWFTEGAKKADALASLGQSIIPASINGVWCWRHKTADGDSVPLADFDDLALKGREVVLAFDSDQAVNEHVQQALEEFTAFLARRGARVGNLKLPHGATKMGVDDAIANGWTYQQLVGAISWTPPTPPRFTIASEDVLYNLPPLRYLDRDMGLCASAFHLIYGASGSGKTFFAIERAMRQASLGRRVLYIPTEDVSGLRYRVAAWRMAHPEASGRLTFLQMPEGLDLQDHRQVADLLDTIAPYEYDHIVLDTLREAHSGDENSSQDTARINRAIQRLVATGAAVDVVHHTGVAGERPRGSTALFGNCDVVIKIENDDGLVRAHFDKIRNAAPRDALAFGLVEQDTGLLDSDEQSVCSCILRPASQFTRRDAPMNANARKVLALLSLSIFTTTGAKTAQVKNAAELPERTVYNALSWLKNKGYISQDDKGDPYKITPTGLAQLGPEYTTASSDSAAERPTASTASRLPPTARQSAAPPTVTAATATTLRGGSAGSAVAVEEQQVIDPMMKPIPARPPNVNDLNRRQREAEELAAIARQFPDEDD